MSKGLLGWKPHIEPIIKEYKQGSDDSPLNKADADSLTRNIRRMIYFMEGLITEEQYINDEDLDELVAEPRTPPDLVFKCPECGSQVLECHETGHCVSIVRRIDPDGEFEYRAAEVLETEGVDRFECSECGYVPSDGRGSVIQEEREMAEFIRKQGEKNGA